MLLIIACVSTAMAREQLVIELAPDVGPMLFAERHGLVHVRRLDTVFGNATRLHEFHLAHDRVTGAQFEAILTALEQGSSAVWVGHQRKRQQHTRVDPLRFKQWHLTSDAPGMNVDGALAENVDGKGVVIAIVDDGVERAHPDLGPAMTGGLSHDFNGFQGDDPSPYIGDSHGTSAAGVACARRDNGVCGIGVASGSTLAGLRLIAEPTSDLDEAEALTWRLQDIDIYSCSWGPSDDAQRMEGPCRLVSDAFERGVREGRQGRGSIYVWAGGNGAHEQDNCNFDGYASDFRTISVSAVDANLQPAWYSERCAMHLVTAPSSGTFERGITTTTQGRRCTDTFGGTSSAAPAIAGAIANMLQVNPALTWRDVQGVLAKSAIRVGYDSDDWSTNVRGYHHSHAFGFGRLDLPTTLAAARSWKAMPEMLVCRLPAITVNQNIPQSDGGSAPLNVQIQVSVTDPCLSRVDFIESVELQVQLRHASRGQVVIRLRDPHGTVSKLSEPRPDYHQNYPPNGWAFGSLRHWGERPQGIWTVTVYDAISDRKRGTFDWVLMTIRGHKEAP